MPVLTIISLTESTSTPIAAMLAPTGELFTDLFPFIALAIGVPLAFFIIKRSIALVPKGR